MAKTFGMKYETRLIWVLGITFGFVFFDRNAANFMMPFIAPDLGLSNQQVGLVASALSFTWAIGGFLGGLWSDRSAHRKTLLLTAVAAFSLCSFLSGLAASFAALLASRLLMGLAEGPILPVSQSLVAFASADTRRGFNMGVMQNFGSNLLGSFAAPLVLVAIAGAWHWRTAFFVAGIPGLIMAGLIARTVREPAVQSDAASGGQRAVHPLEMLRHRNIWLCILMAIFMVAWMVLGWAFLPLYYVKIRAYTSGQMSVMMSVLGLSAAFFSFVVPGLSDRIGRRPIVISFNLIGLLVPLAVLYFNGPPYLLALLVFLGWSASGTFPLFMSTIPAETIPASHVAGAVGLVVGVGEVLGGVSAPAIAGWAADRYGLRMPMLLAAACAIAGTLLALLLTETAPNSLARRNHTAPAN
ncbi:MAG: MFS transporter [Steroidobacteraceae bacterium]